MVKNFFDEQDEPLTPIAASSLTNLRNNNFKKILFISIILGLCILAGVYFFFNVLKSPKNHAVAGQAVSAQHKEALVIPNTYLELDTIIVNLLPSGSKQNYLKLSLTLQLNSELEVKAVKAKFPIIIDVLQSFLRELREVDFNGTGSTLKLKEELIRRINRTTSPIVIKDVLFKEMVIN
jgi:flagellar FliL protein